MVSTLGLGIEGAHNSSIQGTEIEGSHVVSTLGLGIEGSLIAQFRNWNRGVPCGLNSGWRLGIEGLTNSSIQEFGTERFHVVTIQEIRIEGFHVSLIQRFVIIIRSSTYIEYPSFRGL